MGRRVILIPLKVQPLSLRSSKGKNNMQRRRLLAAAPVLAAASFAGTGARAVTTTTPKATQTIFDFGAVGDGVTDDSGAFNKALAWASANNSTVLVPGLNYCIANPIRCTPTGNVVAPWGLLGQGATLTSKITNGADVMFLSSNTVVRYFHMSNIKIQGSGSDGNGLHMQVLSGSSFFYNAIVDGISIEGAGQHGLFVEGNVFESAFNNSFFQDNKKNGATFADSGGGVCSAINIMNCYFNQNGASGLVATVIGAQYGGATDVRVYGGYCRDNQQFGFYYNNGTNGACITQVGFENNCRSLSPGDPNGAHVYSLTSIKMRDCNGYNQGGGATYLTRGWYNNPCLLDGCTQAAGGAMAATGASRLAQVNGANTGIFLMSNSNGGVTSVAGNQCPWQAVNCTGPSPIGNLGLGKTLTGL